MKVKTGMMVTTMMMQNLATIGKKAGMMAGNGIGDWEMMRESISAKSNKVSNRK